MGRARCVLVSSQPKGIAPLPCSPQKNEENREDLEVSVRAGATFNGKVGEKELNLLTHPAVVAHADPVTAMVR